MAYVCFLHGNPLFELQLAAFLIIKKCKDLAIYSSLAQWDHETLEKLQTLGRDNTQTGWSWTRFKLMQANWNSYQNIRCYLSGQTILFACLSIILHCTFPPTKLTLNGRGLNRVKPTWCAVFQRKIIEKHTHALSSKIIEKHTHALSTKLFSASVCWVLLRWSISPHTTVGKGSVWKDPMAKALFGTKECKTQEWEKT
jgi:hypothetical protein